MRKSMFDEVSGCSLRIPEVNIRTLTGEELIWKMAYGYC